MPTYTHIRWEAGPSGWELWGLNGKEDIALLAWVFEVHRSKKWGAIVYEENGGRFDAVREFDTIEDAQAWCLACVRMS